MNSVFEGLKVADFTWAVTGPLVTKYLADFGATVVKVESSLHPDTTRLSAPYAERIAGMNRSGYFALLNRNKYSLSLNLSKPRALEVAKKLVTWADVVVESFAPGVMDRHGLGYDALKQIKPDIIMLRTSTQGQTGPYSSHPGFGYQAAGFIGFPLLIGWQDREPMPIPIAYTDFISFHFGAAALIAALDYRQRTGKGICLDLSQIEASLQFLSPVMLDYVVNSREPTRMGNSSPGSAPHGVYRCKGEDRWCAIAVTNDKQWRALIDVMGNPSWSGEAKFATILARKKNEDELNKLLEAWTSNFAPEELMKRLQYAGVPCGIVADGERLVTDPQIKARDYYWELEHPEIGAALTPSQPFKMSVTPPVPRSPAPCLGEHTEFVCRELLKITDEEFVELLGSGCFE